MSALRILLGLPPRTHPEPPPTPIITRTPRPIHVSEPAWCARCQQHRVVRQGLLCPVCKDDDRLERIELRKARGWV